MALLVDYHNLTPEECLQKNLFLEFTLVVVCEDGKVYEYDEECGGNMVGDEDRLSELGKTVG